MEHHVKESLTPNIHNIIYSSIRSNRLPSMLPKNVRHRRTSRQSLSNNHLDGDQLTTTFLSQCEFFNSGRLRRNKL